MEHRRHRRGRGPAPDDAAWSRWNRPLDLQCRHAPCVEPAAVKFLGDPDDLGWSATMCGKVMAAQRWAISTEIRRRLNRALLDQGVEPNKRGVAPRVARGQSPLASQPQPPQGSQPVQGSQPAPEYVPEPDETDQ